MGWVLHCSAFKRYINGRCLAWLSLTTESACFFYSEKCCWWIWLISVKASRKYPMISSRGYWMNILNVQLAVSGAEKVKAWWSMCSHGCLHTNVLEHKINLESLPLLLIRCAKVSAPGRQVKVTNRLGAALSHTRLFDPFMDINVTAGFQEVEVHPPLLLQELAFDGHSAIWHSKKPLAACLLSLPQRCAQSECVLRWWWMDSSCFRDMGGYCLRCCSTAIGLIKSKPWSQTHMSARIMHAIAGSLIFPPESSQHT